MGTFFQRTKLTVVLLGVAQAVLGIIFFTNPSGATVTVTQMVGWLLIFVGGGTLSMCFFRPGSSSSTMDIIVGAGELILGILMVVNPVFFVRYLFILLGLMVIFTGINDVVDAGRVRSDGSRITLGMGIATLVVGAIMLMAPFLFADAIAIIAGFALAISGITEVFAGLRMP